MLTSDLRSEDSDDQDSEQKQCDAQQDKENTLIDEEHTASKEITIGQNSIQTFIFPEHSSTGVQISSEQIDNADKLCAGSLAVDDERGMEHVNLKESDENVEQRSGLEECKEEARVRVTAKRKLQTQTSDLLGDNQLDLKRSKTEIVQMKQQIADVYEVESYKEYNRSVAYEPSEPTADELFI